MRKKLLKSKKLQKLDEKKAEVEAVVQGVTTGAERLINDVEERVSKNHEDLESVVNELRSELNEKAEEIQNIRESKRVFSNRASESDWKEAYSDEIQDAYILARTSGKGYDTDFGKDVLQKVNEHSGVQVSSADFEQEVSSKEIFNSNSSLRLCSVKSQCDQRHRSSPSCQTLDMPNLRLPRRPRVQARMVTWKKGATPMVRLLVV